MKSWCDAVQFRTGQDTAEDLPSCELGYPSRRASFPGLTMAKPKAWCRRTAEQSLLVDLVTARMPRAEIAKRMGISELKLNRFEARLVSARQSMPPPPDPARPVTVPERSWLDRLFGDS
jgi:hypothetical protein